LIIDLGKQVEVAGLRYTPRQGAAGVTGRIKRFRVYVGDRLVDEKADYSESRSRTPKR
jgi:beta-galactosidase